MRCPRCQHENREQARFCEACGSTLELPCPSCGNLTRFGATFCDQCGTTLAAPPPGSQTRAARSQPHVFSRREAERRQLTAMFCDLVNSTALGGQLDPEELREVLRAYHGTCAEVIRRFDGHVAQYLGDGLLVYFGYPVAHEDDAQRAIRAGLDIVATLPRLNAQLQHGTVISQGTIRRLRETPLQVRIGIHTGPVVVEGRGGRDRREEMALGDTLNVASRLQGIAEPDTVVISAATSRLVQGFFECQARGPQLLKGVPSAIEVYRVLGESGVQSRLEVAMKTGLTPLVGREEEMETLREQWTSAKGGEKRAVLISGEAGIGKSRLVQELKEQVEGEGYARLEVRCSPYYQNTAFYPVIERLQRILQLQREDSPQEKLGKLEHLLGASHLALRKNVPLFAALLSLPHPEGYPALNLTPQRQRQLTLEAVLTWLLSMAEQQPILFVIEDLHWVDPSTLEFLSLLLNRSPTARMLLLLTCRPDFSPAWAASPHVVQIALSRLGQQQIEAMAEKIAGGGALPAEVLQQLVVKTDGIPLFVEELTKMVLESGFLREGGDRYVLKGPLPPLAIPATLQDSLMARLDRLAAVREVAQLGATLGREFSYEMILAISFLDEGTLQQGLAQLVEAELLYQRGVPPQARYIFKHALIQDAAYQSLLRSKRQQVHQHIAQILEERFPETRETQPELLAHHYTQASLVEQAIPYWQRAGQRAVQRSADREAIGHLSLGLELLKGLPNTPERTQQEIRLQITLGASLMATKGYAAPEVEQTYARAWELCQRLGETPRLFPVLMGLLGFYFVRAEHRRAHELGEHLLTLAQHTQDPARLLDAHYTLIATLVFLGKFGAAREHFEQGIVLSNPQQHRLQAVRIGQDPLGSCLTFGAWALWFLGYPDQALKRSDEALILVREISHAFSLAYVLNFAAMLHQHTGGSAVVQERVEEAIALCTEQGFSYWLAGGTILRGWALAGQGHEREGIALMRQGLSAYRNTGAEMLQPYFLALLAEVYGKAGQAEDGLTVLAEALAAVESSQERFWEAELYRLKGELLLAQSRVLCAASGVPGTRHPTPDTQVEAEECFQQATGIARRQQAKSLELRAVMSLSRLWQYQGKKEAARQIVAEVYGWFTEGFDTVDLRAAKVLLEELS